MQKKLQVFISSTYKDLIEERQAAVEEILRQNHIPAGMELFTPGEEQLKTIYRWIDESDVYVLILGGRYGSLEEKTGKSYTQLEYEYAQQSKKPLFAVVIDQQTLQHKAQHAPNAEDVTEVKNHTQYLAFRSQVTNRLCGFYKDLKDIQLVISRTLPTIEKENQLTGWVSGKGLPKDFNEIMAENVRLKKEIEQLKLRMADSEKEEAPLKYEVEEETRKVLSEIRYQAFEYLTVRIPTRVHFAYKEDSDGFELPCLSTFNNNSLLPFGTWSNNSCSFQIMKNEDESPFCEPILTARFFISRGKLLDLGILKSNVDLITQLMAFFADENGFTFKRNKTEVNVQKSFNYKEPEANEAAAHALADLINYFAPEVDRILAVTYYIDELPF